MGRLRPTKRASNLAVFSLSRIFRQTTRMLLRSRARQTLDMLPWPVRPKSSKRFSTWMRGRALLGRLVNSFFSVANRFMSMAILFSAPSRSRLAFVAARLGPLAVVDQARHLGAEILARHDAVDE